MINTKVLKALKKIEKDYDSGVQYCETGNTSDTCLQKDELRLFI
jgi:hypothetical protein